jgi:hypothetical protein
MCYPLSFSSPSAHLLAPHPLFPQNQAAALTAFRCRYRPAQSASLVSQYERKAFVRIIICDEYLMHPLEKTMETFYVEVISVQL